MRTLDALNIGTGVSARKVSTGKPVRMVRTFLDELLLGDTFDVIEAVPC